MENLNNVPSTGTFGGSINQVNHNFGLVKDAIENVEGRTIRSKGLFPTQAALIAAYPSPKVGDYAYVGSSLPATIYDCEVEGTWHNTQQQGGSESVPLNDYPTKSEMNAAIAAIEIETVDNLNEETAASGKALDAHQGFVLAGQIDEVHTKMQDGLNDVENAIFELSTPKGISAGTSTKQYYTYQNGSIVIGSSNNFRCWSPIDISEYYALRIQFYLPVNTNPAAAKTFFTDENDVMVGDFLYNTSGDYKEFAVPAGAKKLYWSTNYNIQSAVGLRGIKRTNKIDGKLNKKDFLLSLSPVENYAGKEYHNGAFTSVSNAVCRKYDVSELELVYVTARWKSQSAGYYKVVFVDESNNTISQLYANTADVDVTLTKVLVNVPMDAKFMYLNSRYMTPVAHREGNGDILESAIKESSNIKEISILFVGNSLTQDAVSYVPLLLRELAPDLSFKLYDWYNGGYKLSQQLADFNNNVACDIFSVCENGTSWANFNNSKTMASVLTDYKFDIVSIQEYFNYQETADVDVFNSVVEYIENHYSHPFKVVTLFHQPIRNNADTVFARTKAGNALFLKETVAEDMIPSGIAIYRAMQTTLDSLGDQGHLSPDGTHAQEGLPCMMQAYVTAMWILKQVGIPISVNNASSIVDDSNYASINVPGPNLGTGVVVGTTEQVRLSQKVAIKAFKEGEYFVNANLTEYTT